MQEWFMSRGPDALLLRTLRLTDNLAPLLPGLTLPKLQEVTLSGDPCPVDIMHGFLQRHPGLTLLNVACKPLAGDAVILNAAVRLPALCDLRLGAAWIPLLMPSAGTCPKLSSFTWNGSLDSGSNVADLQNLLHIVARHQSITTLWLPLWGFISVPGWLQIAEPRAETLMQSVKELYVTYSGKDAAGRMPAALGLFPVLVQVSMSLGKDLGRESNLVDGIVKVCKTVRTVSFGSIFGNEYSVIEKDDGVRTAKLTRKGQTYSDSI
ncbi:hypothetical protein BDZ89DRAFT_1062960 [Hymenopellis radicata]|nr:hypothetical protein BDZ89DRAFT_1062960 [Hymenopellis radicata]